MGSQRIASEMWGRFVGKKLPDPPVEDGHDQNGNYRQLPRCGIPCGSFGMVRLRIHWSMRWGWTSPTRSYGMDLAKLPGYRQQFPILPDW